MRERLTPIASFRSLAVPRPVRTLIRAPSSRHSDPGSLGCRKPIDTGQCACGQGRPRELAASLVNNVSRHRLGPNISPGPLGSPLDSLLGAYARLPIPSREEQVLLGRAIRTWLDFDPSPDAAPPGVQRAGKRAREQMVSRNMMLVATQANYFSVSSSVALEVQDLIQEGAIGLSRAAEKFDPTRGCTFSTYAVPWIRQSMTLLVHTSGSIRIPVKRASSMNRLRQWIEAFTVREGRSPTDEEAIEGMRITAADLRILRQAAAVRQVGSLDALVGDDDGNSLLSFVVAPMTAGGTTQRDLLLAALRPWPKLAETLDRRMDGQTYKEISRAMGISLGAAQGFGKQALAMAKRLVAADQQQQPMPLQVAVEVEIGQQQLSLLPLFGIAASDRKRKAAKKRAKRAQAIAQQLEIAITMEQQLSLLPLFGIGLMHQLGLDSSRCNDVASSWRDRPSIQGRQPRSKRNGGSRRRSSSR